MSLKLLTSQPNCTTITLTFNYELSFSSPSIQWAHSALGLLGEIGHSRSVGYTGNTAGDRIIANLTRKDVVGGTAEVLEVLLNDYSSTLTIYLPLNDVSNTNLEMEFC